MWHCYKVVRSSPDSTALQGLFAFKLRANTFLKVSWCVIVLQTALILALVMFTLRREQLWKRLVDQRDNSGRERRLDGYMFDESVLSKVHVPVVGDSQRVFFNRVPKCGSSAFIDIIQEMSRTNNFTFARSSVYMTFYEDDNAQAVLSDSFVSTPGPLLYERHLHFLPISRFSHHPDPVYINIIRDPLERLVSWYYYRRFQYGHVRDMPTNKRMRTYDMCVLGNYSECVEPIGNDPEEGYFKIIPFFCGQEQFCRSPSEKALLQAVANVKRYYSIVGVTDMFDEFVESLEYTLPSYFKGALYFYKTFEDDLKMKHKTMYKLPVSQEVAVFMRNKLYYEYQFYHFVKNRFQKLVAVIRNSHQIQL